MRAPYSVVLALIVAVGAVPAWGRPFWQKHDSAPVVQPEPSLPGVQPANRLIAQAQSSNSMVATPTRRKGPGPHNGDWLRQYGGLPPAEQEKKLQNDPVFRSLSPESQKHLMDRLRFFNSLAPDKKQKLLERMETYEHLSPEKQQQADILFQRYRGMPPEQQSQVSQAYRKLRGMTPDQRTQYFNSDEFQTSFNDEQRELLHGMSELYPNSPK
jgi:uncharacterized protein DUF3106